MRFAALAVLLAGCLGSDLQTCADGSTCPSGKVCDVPHGGCVAPDQLTVCDGSADGVACIAGSVVGTCFTGVCLGAICGDDVVEQGEQCDPPDPGHGCSADCKSNETCGNGVLDTIAGEQCDDGNLRNHDGCDSQCRTETLGYTVTPLGPHATLAANGVMDEAHGVFIHYDGSATWGWDGTKWSLLATNGPTVYSTTNGYFGVMLYDTDLARPIIVGSSASGNGLDVVYDWDGTQWNKHSIANPAPTTLLAFYHPLDHAIVAIDTSETCTSSCQYNDTTWTLDLSVGQWNETGVPFPGHPALSDTTMRGFFDVARNTPMLVSASGVVYEYNGTQWTIVAGSVLPPVNGLTPTSNMVYDGDRGGVVAWGGCSYDCSGCGPCSQYCTSNGYEWNGVAWTGISGASVPAPDGGELGYDPATHTTFMEVPYDLGSTIPASRAWVLDSQGWTERDKPYPVVSATSNYQGMTFDKGEVVLGTYGTWTYDGSWHQVLATSSTQTAAYDPIRDTVFAFGSGFFELANGAWEPAGVAAPTDTVRAFGFDPIHKRLVLVGRMATWALDSTTPLAATTWQRIADPPIPYSIYASGSGELTFDVAASTMVWTEYSGASYSQIYDLGASGWSPAPSPGVGYLASTWSERQAQLFVDTSAGAPLWEARSNTLAAVSLALPVPFQGDLVDTPSIGQVLGFGTVGTFEGVIAIGYRGPGNDETCDGTSDGDGDGLVGCADPDCWWTCAPACPPGTSC